MVSIIFTNSFNTPFLLIIENLEEASEVSEKGKC